MKNTRNKTTQLNHMKTFKPHQINQIKRYIRAYYKGSFFVENTGPFVFDFGKVSQSAEYDHAWKKFIVQINKSLKADTHFDLNLCD